MNTTPRNTTTDNNWKQFLCEFRSQTKILKSLVNGINIDVNWNVNLKMCAWYYILSLYICSILIAEGGLYMYMVLTATRHGRDAVSSPIGVWGHNAIQMQENSV